MSGGLGGGRPPKPPAPNEPRAANAPAGVQVDRGALRRMIDGDRPPRSRDETPDAGPLDLIGDDRLDLARLQGLSSSLVAEHLMILLATKRRHQPRAEVLADVGDLLASFDDPKKIMSVFNRMPTSGGIVDIYPLEVCAHVLERGGRSDLPIRFAPFIKNREHLQEQRWSVETPISLSVPVALKMRQFALEGGGSPGYFFAPGRPGEYLLEFGEPGRYPMLLRGDVRKDAWIERLTVEVE